MPGDGSVNLIKWLMSNYGLPACGTGGALTRRMAQEIVASGAVTVNGRAVTSADGVTVSTTATLATSDRSASTDGGDVVTIDAAAFSLMQRRIRVWVYDKPEGVDCNLVPSNPASLFHVLARNGLLPNGDGQAQEGGQEDEEDRERQEASAATERVFPVGRLDKDSCGLLVLTNSGSLSERLTHPSFDHPKTYLVTVSQPPPLPQHFLSLMRGGVTWAARGQEHTSAPCRVEPVLAPPALPPVRSVLPRARDRARNDEHAAQGASFTIELRQGLNRQIRHMVETAALAGDGVSRVDGPCGEEPSPDRSKYARVVRLRRIAVGPLRLQDWGPRLCSDGLCEVTGPPLDSFVAWVFGRCDDVDAP